MIVLEFKMTLDRHRNLIWGDRGLGFQMWLFPLPIGHVLLVATFGMVTWERRVSKGSITSHPKGWGPSVPQFLDLHIHSHGMTKRQTTKFCMVYQTGLEENFYVIDHAPCHGKKWHECWRAIYLW